MNENINIADRETWQQCVDNNRDPYGKAAVDAARRVMELLDENEEFDANDLILRADNELDLGLTGFQAGAVAGMVSACHERGEEFRRSWNGEIGKATNQEDSEGVLNPAILHIGEK